MALEYTIDSETFAQLPDVIQAEYEQKDGAYYLQANGMVPKARLDEFRDNNIKLVKQNDEYKKHIDEYGSLTPADIADLKAKAEAGGGKVDDAQMKELVDAEVAKRVQKMNEEHNAALTAEQEARAKSDGMLSKLIIDTNVQTEALKAGVRETAVEDVLLRARSIFRVEDGRAVPYKGDEVVYGKDGQTPQSIGEWLADQEVSAPHLFKESKGSGAPRGSEHKSGGAGDDTKLRGIDKMNRAHTG